MTKEECNISIATGERQLPGFWAKATHYGVVLFCLFFLQNSFFTNFSTSLRATKLPSAQANSVFSLFCRLCLECCYLCYKSGG